MTFGAWVRAERERRRISQTALAARLGIAQPYLSRLENGEQENPGGKLLGGLARELNLSLDEVYAAAGLGPVPTPRGVLLAELRQRTRALGSPRYIQAVLDEIESHQDAPDDAWTALTSVLHSLLMGAEAEQREQGPRRPAPDTGADHHVETQKAGGALLHISRDLGGQYIHDERGEYHAGPAIGC